MLDNYTLRSEVVGGESYVCIARGHPALAELVEFGVQWTRYATRIDKNTGGRFTVILVPARDFEVAADKQRGRAKPSVKTAPAAAKNMKLFG